MPARKGRQEYLAVKTEATRLTAETTSFTRFVPFTSFESKNEITYDVDESAFANRGALLDKQIVSKYGVWSAAGKLDVDVVDFFLHHAIGSSSPTTADGATTRVYTLLQSLQLPTFTTQFTRGDEGAKRLRGCSPATLEINFTQEDSTYTVAGHAIEEEGGNSVTAAYTKPTRKLLGKNLNVYHAATLAGLGTIASPDGTAFNVRTAKLALNNGVDATKHFELGALTPTDIPADGYKLTLEMELIHMTTNSSVVFQTNYEAGTPMAFRLDAVGTNLPNIGSSSLKPRLTVDLPPSRITVGNAIPLDDLITQTVSVEIEMANLAVYTTVNALGTV